MTLDLATTELSDNEQQFLYNMDVLKMPQARAAEMANIAVSPQSILIKPYVIEAREKLRAALRARVGITKEDVLNGLRDAIQQADLLGEPMSQIAGWREISKMLGYDAPKVVNVIVTGDVQNVRRQIGQLSDSELTEMLGAGDVIDADFYPSASE